MVVQASEQVIGHSIDRDEHRTYLPTTSKPRLPQPEAGPLERVSTPRPSSRQPASGTSSRRSSPTSVPSRERGAQACLLRKTASERQKRRALDGLTEGMKTSTTNFLKVLVDNGREDLEEVLAGSDRQGAPRKIEVEVTTAVDLSDDQLDSSKNGSETSSKLRNRLETNPDLSGAPSSGSGNRLISRGRARSLREGMLERMLEISSILKALLPITNRVRTEEVGQVLEVGDAWRASTALQT